MKLLKDLLYGVRIQEIIGNTQIAIESICYDSRKSSKNALFVAISGTQVDGHDFIETAIDLGAIAVPPYFGSSAGYGWASCLCIG